MCVGARCVKRVFPVSGDRAIGHRGLGLPGFHARIYLYPRNRSFVVIWFIITNQFRDFGFPLFLTLA